VGFLNNLALALLGLALPPRCHVCRQIIPEAGVLHICPDCYADLPFLKSPVCSVCGIPMAGVGDDHPCGSCIIKHPPYSVARAALRYEGACRTLIHAFKYQYKSHLRRPLGLLTAQILASFAADLKPELLVPTPLHISRLRSRGFNQSVLLAEVLARQWGIPLLRQGLVRIRPTVPQMELNREQRLRNLRGAFSVKDASLVANRRIMLVDDVFTTGSTLAECARALLQAGCSDVCAVTVAHAP